MGAHIDSYLAVTVLTLSDIMQNYVFRLDLLSSSSLMHRPRTLPRPCTRVIGRCHWHISKAVHRTNTAEQALAGVGTRRGRCGAISRAEYNVLTISLSSLHRLPCRLDMYYAATALSGSDVLGSMRGSDEVVRNRRAFRIAKMCGRDCMRK
jgi:hypothetical protein